MQPRACQGAGSCLARCPPHTRRFESSGKAELIFPLPLLRCDTPSVCAVPVLAPLRPYAGDFCNTTMQFSEEEIYAKIKEMRSVEDEVEVQQREEA